MINTAETAKYYAVFYFAAFALAFIFKLFEGKHRDYPWVTWLTLCIFSQVVFVIGTKVITLSGNEWRSFFNSFTVPENLQRSVLGGMLSFLLVYIIARFSFKFKNDFLDAVAIPTAIGLTVQRFGCFFAGCCFGNPSNLPWAIRYNSHSPAYICQADLGLFNISQTTSLPVHPVQLYYVAAGIAIITILFIFRKRLLQGNLFLLLVALYSFSRALIEFFVSPMGNQIGGHIVFGLKLVQWVLFIVGAMVFAFVLFREKRSKSRNFTNTYLDEDYHKSLPLLFITIILFYLFRNWFSILEQHLLVTMFFITIILIVAKLYAQSYRPLLRLAHIIVLTGSILFMSQTIDSTSNKSQNPIISKQLGFGISLGDYENSSNEMCNNTYYQHKYSAAQISYLTTKQDIDKLYEWHTTSFKLILGKDYIISSKTRSQIIDQRNKFMFGINPNFNFNFKYWGFSAGMLCSNFNQNSSKGLPIVPQLGFRAGPENLLYFKSELYPNSYIGTAFPYFTASIGSGLGKFNSNYVEVGFGLSDYVNSNIIIISGNFTISDKLHFVPKLMYGNNNNNQSSIGITYKLGK